jgi:hypothetical protein
MDLSPRRDGTFARSRDDGAVSFRRPVLSIPRRPVADPRGRGHGGKGAFGGRAIRPRVAVI